jgi:RNA polymerase sigma-70 factor, ECF subfamily
MASRLDMVRSVNEQPAEDRRRNALAELLPELRAFARFLSGSRAEADDLVQEAVVRTLQALPRLEADIELRPWCMAVVRNTFHEQLRRRKREARQAATAGAPQVSQAAQEVPGQLRELGRALAALPPLLREALVLVGAQGLSHEAAAQLCGVPLGTMKARVSRARRQLATALDRVNE